VDLSTIVAISWWMIVPLAVLGSLLHFLYDWSRHNRVVAVFSAVNESYWEHIKIAVWPVLLLQVVLFAAGGWRYPAFVPAATIALYAIPIAMVGLVYLYKHFLGRNILWLDIALFVVAIAIAQATFVDLVQRLDAGPLTIVGALVFLTGLLVAFTRFTLVPPPEPDVFLDPITRKYGIRAHPDAPSDERD